MEFWKPADLPARTIVIRPKRALSGRFSFGMTLDWGVSKCPVVAVEWCGARGLVVLGGVKRHDRLLRLPANLNPSDLYALSVAAPIELRVSMALHSQDAGEEDFEVEGLPEGGAPAAVCADPSASVPSPPAQDVLSTGYLPAPARQRAAVCRIRSLRAFAEGALLRIALRRSKGVPGARELLVVVAVGAERRLFIIPAGRAEIEAAFHLIPQTADEVWPVTWEASEALEWSAVVRRGFDPVALPGFSLEGV